MNVRLDRRASAIALDALTSFRIVVLDGPRQSGKTTLLRQLGDELGLEVRSFDDPAELAAARSDPLAYLESAGRPLAIDEFQRAGDEFVLALKYVVDRHSGPGQYILAGSTNFLTTGQLSDSLAGRVGLVRVRPFTRGELLRRQENFVAQLVDEPASVAQSGEGLSRHLMAELIVMGGFPEVALGIAARMRAAYFESYTRTVLSREAIGDAGSRRHPMTLRRLFELVAARTAQELNIDDLARDAGHGRVTVEEYLSLLQTLHQVQLLPAWASSAATRAKRRPKLLLIDSGIAAASMRLDVRAVADPRTREAGPLLETYVVNELLRQADWSVGVRASHYRDRDGREVDLVLDGPHGVVGIEVKFSSVPRAVDGRHLTYLSRVVGERWLGGVVIHTGAHAMELSPGVWAVPLDRVWASSGGGSAASGDG